MRRAAGLVPNTELPWGLRRVDGSNNNLVPGQELFGAAGQLFPRTQPAVRPNDQDGDSLLFGPPGTTPNPGVTLLTNTDYGVIALDNPAITRGIQPGDVVDADPRTISNLVVDQTVNNPAALFKALQDAGLGNAAAFALLDDYAAAVKAVKDARAEGVASNGAVTAALAALNTAQQNLATAIANADPVFAATFTAYQAASAAAAQLSDAIAAVQLATTALANEVVAGPADPNDASALALTQSSVAALLVLANDIVAALNDPAAVVIPSDLAAAQAFVDYVQTELADPMSGINLANGVSVVEDAIISA